MVGARLVLGYHHLCMAVADRAKKRRRFLSRFMCCIGKFALETYLVSI